jgi:hypothetical protein
VRSESTPRIFYKAPAIDKCRKKTPEEHKMAVKVLKVQMTVSGSKDGTSESI